MERSQSKMRRSLGQRVDQEVEKIIQRVMTHEGLEESVNRAIQKAVVELVTRYFALVAVAIVLLLSLHSVLLVMLLKSDFPHYGSESRTVLQKQ